MRTHGAVVGRRFRSVTKLTTKVRIGKGYLWGSFLIAAAALKTPTRNGYNAQGVNLNCYIPFVFQVCTAVAFGAWQRGQVEVTVRVKPRLEWGYGGVFLFAAALRTPTTNGYNSQGGNLKNRT